MKKLSLEFDTEIIELDYIPERLSFTDSMATNTVPTINGSTTFIPPPETIRTDYNIVARVYQAQKTETGLIETLAGVAGGAALAVGAQLLNEKQYKTARNVIILARGVYDVGSDIIQAASDKFQLSLPPAGLDKLNKLRQFQQEGVPCIITWDLDDYDLRGSDDTFGQDKYLITRMDVSAIKIQEETLETIAYEVNISLINQGTKRVQVRTA